jgi:hypothetical protein
MDLMNNNADGSRRREGGQENIGCPQTRNHELGFQISRTEEFVISQLLGKEGLFIPKKCFGYI